MDAREKINCKIVNKLSPWDNEFHLYSGSFLIRTAGSIEDLILWIDNQNKRKSFVRVYDYKIEVI